MRGSTFGLAVVAVSTLAAAPTSAQTVHHVAPPAQGGSDANPGTLGLPFATIQRGASAAQAGDTVVVHPGVYAGFNAVRSGTAGAPITFRGMPGAVVNAAAAPQNGNHRSRINIDNLSWIVIEGFEVVGTNDLRVSNEGIRMVGPPGTTAGDIVIRGCHVHHNGNRNIFSGHINRITVEDCLLHHAAAEHGVYLSNSGDGHIVRRNTIHSNASAGIHLNSDASQGGDGVMTGLVIEGTSSSGTRRGRITSTRRGTSRCGRGAGRGSTATACRAR